MTAAAVGDRIDRLLAQLRAGPDPRAAAIAEELVRSIVGLYGTGLERVAAIVGPERVRDLCDDPIVESLLLVHDLHPLDAATRVRRALDRLGPQLGALTLVGIADGVARVRLAASGCGVRATVESAVLAAAPELAGVEVEIAAPLLTIGRRP